MELYRGDLAELVAKLHADGAHHIWVDGGVTISQFLAAQMVDTMTIGIIPIILGEGLPLFNVVGKELPCRLISSQSYASGLVQLNYEIIKEFSLSKDKIIFKVIDFGGDDYKKSVSLQEEILRKPLRLTFTEEELELEKEHIHIAGFLGQEICTTAVLVPEGNTTKMQRVATKASFQNKGIGSLMMAFCEEYAREHGYGSVYCHARGTAIPFYLKNQYALEGDPFDEDGIPHHKMRKILS
jgi:predicted GNAT family N-acyltransferase